MSDRRQHRRVKISQAIQLTAPDGFWDRNIPAHTATLSATGISVETESPLPSAAEYTVRIPLPGRKTWIEASMQKVWEVVGSEAAASRYGFIFSDIRSTYYKELSRFISELHSDKLSSIDRRSQDRRRANAKMASSNQRAATRRWRLPTYPLYIGGRDVDTGSYEYFPYVEKLITDPKTTSQILLSLKSGDVPMDAEEYVYGRCCTGDDSHNHQAIQEASTAFQKFGSFPLSKRLHILEDIHKLLLAHKNPLLELFVAEGHPKKMGEWEFTGMLRAYESESLSFYQTEFARNMGKNADERAILIRRPDGVICVSPPRNAACSNSLTGGLTLLGGNTLVVKPPLTSPISTIYMWRHVIDEALRLNGAPRGTLNIVVGNTGRFINQWIANPLVNDIIYFGESNRGLEIGKKIYAAGKKPILELSGKDYMLVWEDCDVKSAVDSLVDCFLGSTQICMVPKMALVHERIYDQFSRLFLEKVSQLRVGLPSDPDTCLSPVGKVGPFFEFLEDATTKGAKLLHGGQRLNYRGAPDENGMYLEPTILTLEDGPGLQDLRCVREENFFPLLPLIKVTSSPPYSRGKHHSKNEIIYSKMVDIANRNDYGLRISVWCSADSFTRRFVHDIRNCGLLRVNCRHVDFSMFLATHGGPGKTGGPFGELNYFWQKSTHLQGVNLKD